MEGSIIENNSIINKFDNIVNNINNFSGVIKIKKNEAVVYEKAVGYADIANERNNMLDTRFGIASGAKLLTAIAICKLIEEGKLQFNSLLKTYLAMDNFDDNITIKHLLTHTSGIPDYFDEEVLKDFSELWHGVPMYMMKEPRDFLKLMSKQKMMFKPGEKFQYNNGGYVVLAYVVRQVSGKSFVDYVKENVLDVLGIEDSGYFSMDMLPKNCAYGYEETSNGNFKTNIYSIPIIGGGDGGVFMTADDVSKLWSGLFNYKLLSKEITDEMLKPHVNVHEDVYYYGLGVWIVKNKDSIYEYYITGSDPGVTFDSSVFVKEKLEVTVLGNKAFDISDIIKEVQNLL